MSFDEDGSTTGFSGCTVMAVDFVIVIACHDVLNMFQKYWIHVSEKIFEFRSVRAQLSGILI